MSAESPIPQTSLDKTLLRHDPAHMLAWSEAYCRDGVGEAVFSLWEPACRAAVLGLSQDAQRELRLDALEADGIPVLRRASGGGAVLLSPGVLCFEIHMPVDASDPCPDIHGAFRTAAEPVVAACRLLGVKAVRAGISDLAAPGCKAGRAPESAVDTGAVSDANTEADAHTDIGVDNGTNGDPDVEVDMEADIHADTEAERATLYKICGTAQLRKRGTVLVHGSLLVQVDTGGFGRYLRFPSEVPSYRDGRDHASFCRTVEGIRGCTTTPVDVAAAVRGAMAAAGVGEVRIPGTLSGLALRLLEGKYRLASWNLHRQRPKGL